jgi:hypothetical protein
MNERLSDADPLNLDAIGRINEAIFQAIVGKDISRFPGRVFGTAAYRHVVCLTTETGING